MASKLKFYVPVVSLAVLLTITVGVVIYQRRQLSGTPPQRGPVECTNQQIEIPSTPTFDYLTFTEDSSEYMSLGAVEWKLYYFILNKLVVPEFKIYTRQRNYDCTWFMWFFLILDPTFSIKVHAFPTILYRILFCGKLNYKDISTLLVQCANLYTH